jgi:hypothetical protein
VLGELAFQAPKSVHVESGSLAVNIARTASLEGEKQVNDRFEVRIEQCRNLPVPALRAKYEKVFGETPRSRNKDYLFRRIAWRLQANHYGDLSDEARQRALAMADVRDLRIDGKPGLNHGKPGCDTADHRSQDLRLPLPGTVLTRSFRGRTVKVCVLANGFRHEDRQFRSLSGVTQHITGTRWNGYVFWGLQGRKAERRG